MGTMCQSSGLSVSASPGDLQMDDDAWDRAVHLGSTITREELLALPVPEIIHRLYHEEDIRLFSRMPVSFRCSCSRDRVESVLRMLGHGEIRSILEEQGTVQVDCEFYRRRKEKQLREYAQQIAQQVSQTRRDEVLDPMNPYERRIVHIAVNQVPGITSESLGDGFLKRVKIFPIQTPAD